MGVCQGTATRGRRSSRSGWSTDGIRGQSRLLRFRDGAGRYAALFRIVEVQQTFYQPPRIATLEAWQLITHEATSATYRRLKRELQPSERPQCGAFRLTPIVREAWETTRAAAAALERGSFCSSARQAFSLRRTTSSA